MHAILLRANLIWSSSQLQNFDFSDAVGGDLKHPENFNQHGIAHLLLHACTHMHRYPFPNYVLGFQAKLMP